MSRLLTCPDCSARYCVPSDAIGPDGTTVRCTACESTWFVEAEAATPDALELRDLEEAEQGDVALVPAPAPVGAVDMKPETYGVRAPNAATLYRQQKSASARRGRLKAILAVWLVALLILAVAVIAAILLRQSIVERFPAASGIYSGLGMTTTASGFDIANLDTRFASIDGTEYVIVEGAVRNLSGQSRVAPIVVMALLGPGDVELVTWSMDTGQAPLGAGETRDFISEYPGPAVDATGLRVSLEGGSAERNLDFD